MFKLIKTIVLVLASFFLGTLVYAQQKNMLRAGDSAPALKYSKWFKGDPIQEYDADHIYILEFWATWCGPCRAAMPHLTALQKQYAGRATVIGVNILESNDDSKPYDASLPRIEAFIKANDANLDYAVFADNNEQYMKKNWFEAAGLNGIPATFIVKENKILWIGHPEELDSILVSIFDGTYDMQTATVSLENDQKEYEAYNNATTAIVEAFIDGNREKGEQLIEQAKIDFPKRAISISFMKFVMLLMNIGEKEALKFGGEWQKENAEAALYMLNLIGEEAKYNKETYAWVVENFESSGQKAYAKSLKQLAFCNAQVGNYKKAVKYQEDAIMAANEARENGDTANVISENELKIYANTLEKYKKRAK